MIFLGFLKVGKRVSHFAVRAAEIDAQRSALAVDIAEAKEARRTVIAQLGEELKELDSLASK